jgi:hypothetical protein
MSTETNPETDWQVEMTMNDGAQTAGWKDHQETPLSSEQPPDEESIRFSDWQLEPYFDQPADTLSGRWYGKLASFGL